MTQNKKNIFSLKKDKRYVRPNGLHVRSNLVPGLTYDRLIGKSYLQAWIGVNLASHISKLACEVEEISQVSRVLFVNKINVTNGQKIHFNICLYNCQRNLKYL